MYLIGTEVQLIKDLKKSCDFKMVWNVVVKPSKVKSQVD